MVVSDIVSIFDPYLGKIEFFTSIFLMAWNHQLEKYSNHFVGAVFGEVRECHFFWATRKFSMFGGRRVNHWTMFFFANKNGIFAPLWRKTLHFWWISWVESDKKTDAGHAFYIGDFFVEKEIQNQEETVYLKVPLFQFWRFQCVFFCLGVWFKTAWGEWNWREHHVRFKTTSLPNG